MLDTFANISSPSCNNFGLDSSLSSASSGSSDFSIGGIPMVRRSFLIDASRFLAGNGNAQQENQAQLKFHGGSSSSNSNTNSMLAFDSVTYVFFSHIFFFSHTLFSIIIFFY